MSLLGRINEAGEGTFAVHTNTSGEKFWGNAGAGVLPIAKSTGRILIGLRSPHVNEPGTYGVFGGAMDPGEDPEQAAKREFREELGYRGSLKLMKAYVFKSPGGGFTFHNFIGLVDDEFNPKLDWETASAKWVSLPDLMRMSKKHFGMKTLLRKNGRLVRAFVKSAKGLGEGLSDAIKLFRDVNEATTSSMVGPHMTPLGLPKGQKRRKLKCKGYDPKCRDQEWEVPTPTGGITLLRRQPLKW